MRQWHPAVRNAYKPAGAERSHCLCPPRPLFHTHPYSWQDLLHNVYNAARAPTRAHFDSYMRRVQELKPATYAHLMTVLPLSSWTHHAGKQGTRIGDTVTSNNAESVINMVGAEVRLL